MLNTVERKKKHRFMVHDLSFFAVTWRETSHPSTLFSRALMFFFFFFLSQEGPSSLKMQIWQFQALMFQSCNYIKNNLREKIVIFFFFLILFFEKQGNYCQKLFSHLKFILRYHLKYFWKASIGHLRTEWKLIGRNYIIIGDPYNLKEYFRQCFLQWMHLAIK